MYELNLLCPECGCIKFEYTEYGTWVCEECGWEGITSQMTVHAFHES